jgi:translation initiation factor 1
MNKNLFEMGASFSDEWSSDNKEKSSQKKLTEIMNPEKHLLHFAMEKRRGKIVTIVKPFCLEKSELQKLLKTLKKKMGTGGTVKEDSLEFQGEVKEKLKTQLEKLSFRLK